MAALVPIHRRSSVPILNAFEAGSMRDVRREHEDIRHAADKVVQDLETTAFVPGMANTPDLKLARFQAESDFVDFFKSQCDQSLPDGKLIDQISKIKNGGIRNRALFSLSLCELKFATVAEAIKTAVLIQIDDASQARAYEAILFHLRDGGKKEEAIALAQKLIAEHSEAYHRTYKTTLQRTLAELQKD